MIAPTKMYDQMPIDTPDDAADMVAEAIIERPKRIATKLGLFSEVLHLAAPRISEVVMNTAYKMFPDSSAAKGDKARDEKRKDVAPTPEAALFASLLRGVHW
jgi:hypothetical protein